VKQKIAALLLIAGLLTSCATARIFNPGYADFEEGLALFNQGHFDAAIPYFQRASVDNPNFAPAYLYLGRSYVSLRRWREALPPLRTAYRLAPGAAKDEAFNVLMDALFAAAIDGFLPDSPRPSGERPKERL
jgi:tetratricopeptide (TPR) repeat protein